MAEEVGEGHDAGHPGAVGRERRLPTGQTQSPNRVPRGVHIETARVAHVVVHGCEKGARAGETAPIRGRHTLEP